VPSRPRRCSPLERAYLSNKPTLHVDEAIGKPRRIFSHDATNSSMLRSPMLPNLVM
jgi:hypothetical protein